MIYLLDGYNLIFSLIHSKESLKTMRQKVIREVQKRFEAKAISGMIVFDGAHRREEESGLSYASPLTIAYAPRGQSADEYILEQIESAAHPSQIIVVTDDRGLARLSRAAGAQTRENKAFLQWLYKKKKRVKSAEPKETKQNIERLLKLFEEKLKEEDS